MLASSSLSAYNSRDEIGSYLTYAENCGTIVINDCSFTDLSKEVSPSSLLAFPQQQQNSSVIISSTNITGFGVVDAGAVLSAAGIGQITVANCVFQN